VCFDKTTTKVVATTPSSKNTKPGDKTDMSKEPKDQGRTGTDGKNDKIQNPGSVRAAANSVSVNAILVVFAIVAKMAAH
jgi:hypothetical protein